MRNFVLLLKSQASFTKPEKAAFTARPRKRKLLRAIIYRGYQFKKISTIIMQESIQTPSGIYIMYHDTACHDADHGYEEIL